MIFFLLILSIQRILDLELRDFALLHILLNPNCSKNFNSLFVVLGANQSCEIAPMKSLVPGQSHQSLDISHQPAYYTPIQSEHLLLYFLTIKQLLRECVVSVEYLLMFMCYYIGNSMFGVGCCFVLWESENRHPYTNNPNPNLTQTLTLMLIPTQTQNLTQTLTIILKIKRSKCWALTVCFLILLLA